LTDGEGDEIDVVRLEFGFLSYGHDRYRAKGLKAAMLPDVVRDGKVDGERWQPCR
jgi:hypothetical protein